MSELIYFLIKSVSWKKKQERELGSELCNINRYCLVLAILKSSHSIEELRKYYSDYGDFDDYEDALIQFKEKCTGISSELCLLNKEPFSCFLNKEYVFNKKDKYNEELMNTYCEYTNRPKIEETQMTILWILILPFFILLLAAILGKTCFRDFNIVLKDIMYVLFIVALFVLETGEARKLLVLKDKINDIPSKWKYSINEFSCLKSLDLLKKEIDRNLCNKAGQKNNLVNQLQETIDYSKKTDSELAEIFNDTYSEQIKFYPDFLTILQTVEYGGHIILNENFSFTKKEDRKMVLNTISKAQPEKNNVKLLKALFKVNVKNVSDLITQDPPEKLKIPEFKEFLLKHTK